MNIKVFPKLVVFMGPLRVIVRSQFVTNLFLTWLPKKLPDDMVQLMILVTSEP